MSFDSNVCKKISYSIEDLTVRKNDFKLTLEDFGGVDEKC